MRAARAVRPNERPRVSAAYRLAAAAGNGAFADAVASAGRPLGAAARAPVEVQLGVNLSDVRVHTGPVADVAAEQAGARAMTSGRDIVLGRGESPGGRRLIAHELAHVAHWKLARALRPGTSQPGDEHERHASAVARDATSSGAATAGPQPSSPVPAVSRQEAQREGQTQARGQQATPEDVIVALMALRRSNPSAFVDMVVRNEQLIYRLLSSHGFRGSWVDPNAYLADFDGAFERWLRAGNFARLRALPPLTLAVPTEQDENEEILGALPDGTGYVGTRRSFRAAARRQYAERSLQTLRNIASGPGGAIGYMAGGDRGSDLGAAVDGIVTGLGGVAQGRAQMRSVSSAVPERPVAAEVRPSTRAPSAGRPPPAPRLENEPIAVVPSPRPAPAPAARPTTAPPAPPPTRAAPAARTATAPPVPKPAQAPAAPPAPAAYRTAEREVEEFHAMAREETGAPARAAGAPTRLRPHGRARQHRQQLGLTSEEQSAHGLAQAVGRNVPGYDPNAALTTFQRRATHTALDQPMKNTFMQMRREGRTTASGQEIHDAIASSIRQSPLPKGTRDSLVARLPDEMFVEFGMSPQTQYTLPYPNIKPRP